jgi:hypothetical protein
LLAVALLKKQDGHREKRAEVHSRRGLPYLPNLVIDLAPHREPFQGPAYGFIVCGITKSFSRPTVIIIH